MSEFPMPINQGWICPKCGRCYAPSVLLCSYCVPASPKCDAHECTCAISPKCAVHKNTLDLGDK